MAGKIVAFCTGGLCNAISGLFVGSWLSKELGVPLCIYWIEGYIALDIGLLDIFDIIDDGICMLKEEEFKEVCARGGCDMLRFAPELPEFGLCPVYRCRPQRFDIKAVGSLASLKEMCTGRDVFLNTCELPAYLMVPEVVEATFERFRFKAEHVERVKRFVTDAGVGKVGVHVRGTDILSISGRNMDDIRRFVAGVKGRFDGAIFLCSDDEAVEREYVDDDRLRFYPGKVYVCKRDEGLGWYHDAGTKHIGVTETVEFGGKEYKNYSSTNVVRTKEHCIGGWIDLMTLARMDNIVGFVTSGGSTYFRMALLWNSCAVFRNIFQQA